MKKIKNKKIRERLYQSSILKKIRHRNRYIRNRNILRNKRKRKPKSFISQFPSYINICIPKDFDCRNNIESVLGTLKDIYNKCQPFYIRHIHFDFRNIIKIDLYSICMLLSLINKLSSRMSSGGNYPLDDNARNIIIDSGFSDLVNTNIKIPTNKEFRNHMYMVGKNHVEASRIGKYIKEAMVYLSGTETHFPPVYDCIIEICSNSVEHSNNEEKNKNWLISISYEPRKIHFILTDTGEGILKTLHKKKVEMFRDTIFFKKDDNVLLSVFNKEYQSRTGEINRHKGLPNVMDAFKDGYIGELKVLTNYVFYDFTTMKSSILDTEFSGTMFSWTITRANFEKWKLENCA